MKQRKKNTKGRRGAANCGTTSSSLIYLELESPQQNREEDNKNDNVWESLPKVFQI